MVGIELVRNKMTKEPYPVEARIGHRVAAEAQKRGLLIRPLGNIILLLPPLSITKHELARMVEILYEAIATQSKEEEEVKKRWPRAISS
jgi:adenosylmethionine-8-amino-7-oxononanoate aminotransferase